MAALQGLGEAAVRSVPTDPEGRMDVTALERDIAAARAEGALPFLVLATAGKFTWIWNDNIQSLLGYTDV